MNINRLFIIVFFATLGAIAFWQIMDEAMVNVYWNVYQVPSQKKSQEKQAQTRSICEKYSAVAPLVTPLKGKVISLQGTATGGTISQIASLARQALPGTPVFANGTIEERVGFDMPTFVRTGIPADAVVVNVATRFVDITEEQKGENKVEGVQTVVVADSTGKKLGQWQGFIYGSCANVSAPGQVSLAAFFASQRSGSGSVLASSRTPPYQELQFDIQSNKTKQVARPEDFNTPASMPGCAASLIKESDVRDQTLRISTGVGTVLFRYVKADQTLPAVACSDNRFAILFRTPTQVSVIVLDRNGFMLGVGRIPFKKITEREVFRDLRIEDGKLRATLLAFELDKKGTLAAYDGRALVVGLGADPEPPKNFGDALGMVKHTSCKQPPELDREIQVHELPNMFGAREYVHIPGQEPIPFLSVLVDAPMQSVAVSFPETAIEMVWLVQATPGTDLRYVEISGSVPQTVLVRSATAVNVATTEACHTLFSQKSPSRSTFKITRQAYRENGQRRIIEVVLLGNGNPFVSPDFTYQAVSAFGYLHLSSLSLYYSHLIAEGFLKEATIEDYRRFNDYFYKNASMGRRVLSWFKQDPALDIQASAHNNASYLVKGSFPLPKHPDDSIKDALLLVEKNGMLPSGNLQPYRILDANTLSCAGTQSNCPWAK
jgi:hypothetical protein